MSAGHSSHDLVQEHEFIELARRKNRVSIVLTLLTLFVYYGFIWLIAYRKEFFAQKIAGIAVGIPLGIGVIVLSVLFTGLYVAWANKNYDGMVEGIQKKIAEETNASS